MQSDSRRTTLWPITHHEPEPEPELQSEKTSSSQTRTRTAIGKDFVIPIGKSYYNHDREIILQSRSGNHTANNPHPLEDHMKLFEEHRYIETTPRALPDDIALRVMRTGAYVFENL